MGLDPRALPQRFINLMAKPERKELGVKTTAEIDEKIELENERELQRECANLLRLRSIWFFKSRMDRRTTNPLGTPDFMFSIDGRAIAVECKTEHEDLEDDQKDTMRHMVSNGWSYHVVRSVPEMKTVLGAYGQ